MKHVLVGAGAVGISYGWYLAKGGDSVAYRVKDKYAAALGAGTHVYFPKKRGVREPLRFGPSEAVRYDVITSDDEVAFGGCDVAWLCMSSTALRGPWLEPFLASLGPDTTLVMLTPGAEDKAYLAARFPLERIVQGLITLVAWQTPLPGEAPHPPGIAVWFPPLAKLPFRGDPARARAIVDAMNRGGKKVAKFDGPEIPEVGTVASGILTSHVAALEGVGWTFAALRKSPLRREAAAAAREAMGVLSALLGKRPPFGRHFVRPWVVGSALRLAAWRMPFDFEVYLEYHFTKVRDQTEMTMAELERIGRERGLPVEHIAGLRRTVFGA